MSGSLILLHLAGAVALLIWATRMVRTGVERAHGAALRRVLNGAANNPLKAAVTGLGAAVMLQSSAAVALLVTGFAAGGMIALPIGLAMVLGADLGSALVARILSFDLSWLAPICLVAGVASFLASERRTVRQTGRILVGLGLVLLALRLIGTASAPLRESEALPLFLSFLSRDPAIAFLAAALFTWLVHSSVAVVLMLMAMAAQNVIPVPLALVFMLGANLGGAAIAASLTRNAPPETRPIATGNLLLRGLFAGVGLVVLTMFDIPATWFGSTPGGQIANAHLAFNALLLLLGLPFIRPVSALCSRMQPAPAPAPDDVEAVKVSSLDRSVIDVPSLALASATREVLRMSETVEVMLRQVFELYEEADKPAIKRLTALDDEVDRAHTEIKLYLAEVSRNELSEEEARQCMVLTDFCIKLEHVGDIIVMNLIPHVEKKRTRNVEFSSEGWHELTKLHERVVKNMQLALNVLVSGDPASARRLIEEKGRMRRLEEKSNERHFARLRERAVKSIETSEIHLDTIRDLKQINSLISTVANPILRETGELLDSRLTAESQG